MDGYLVYILITAVTGLLGYGAVCLTPEQTKFGSVESLGDARACADLFKQHRDEIDGVLVALPNFGDERAIGLQMGF